MLPPPNKDPPTYGNTKRLTVTINSQLTLSDHDYSLYCPNKPNSLDTSEGQQMPVLNKQERVEALMRYLHSHTWQQNTADSLGKALDIPVASVRQTIYRDYPECFDRDPDDRRNIILTMAYPNGRYFDLELKLSDTQKPRYTAEYLSGTRMDLYLSQRTSELITEWANVSIAGNKKPPQEYYTLMNSLNHASLLLQLVRSPNPQKRLKELVDDPDNVPKTIKNYITALEKGLSKR